MLIVKATCPHCGAPLSLSDGQRHVICAYCDHSSLVDHRPRPDVAAANRSSASVGLSPEAASPDDIRRIKRLIFEGRRAEAVSHYAKVTGLSDAEAEAAVSALMVPELSVIYRQLPLAAIGFVISALVTAAFAGGAAYGVANASEGVGFVVLAGGCAGLLVLFVRSLIPKLVSSWVSSFGARGRARVVKRTVIHTFDAGHMATLLLFEVQPAGGGAPFFDEEALLVRPESFDKLAPGNVVWARYDEPNRRRVFPLSPIQVATD
jgi:LSD1 subclass zinc finger protein